MVLATALLNAIHDAGSGAHAMARAANKGYPMPARPPETRQGRGAGPLLPSPRILPGSALGGSLSPPPVSGVLPGSALGGSLSPPPVSGGGWGVGPLTLFTVERRTR